MDAERVRMCIGSLTTAYGVCVRPGESGAQRARFESQSLDKMEK